MIKSIKLKLWLTLFVTLLLSLGALLGVTYFSMKQRFLDYATGQILDRLAPLEQAVIAVYNEGDSLAPFIDAPSRWTQLRDTTYRQYLQEQQRRPMAPFDPQRRDLSTRESIEKELQHNQRAFFQYLVLYDPNKKAVAGRMKDGAKYVLRSLSTDEGVIAYIGYVKPKDVLRSVDKLFVDQQIRVFGILSLLMVFAALLVTIVMSRWLVNPLTRLSKNAKRVAMGDFSARIDLRADDELGRLCHNFDEMTRSLEKNELTRKQWVADISHEMRTPLSVLKAQIEAMEDGIREASSANLRLLSRNVDSLSLIINDLYELSLADLGELTLHKKRFDLLGLVIQLLAEFSDKFKQKQISVIAPAKEQGAVEIFADKNRIKQVLINLLENSYRYTNSGGGLRVRLNQQQTTIVIEIEDSAPGVPQNKIARIYDRLYRLESSRNRETGGAGLGLSICKGFIDAHGGTIEASSSELGGLKQTITLPQDVT